MNHRVSDDGIFLGVSGKLWKSYPCCLIVSQSAIILKVVFRRVPSGKGYSKNPRHLLAPGYSSPIKKRKANFTEEDLEGTDVYSFDEGEDFQGPAKRTKYDSR